MPSFCIFQISVVRFTPSRAAAPFLPPTIQPVSPKACRMWSRSQASSVAVGAEAPRFAQESHGAGGHPPLLLVVTRGRGDEDDRIPWLASASRRCSSKPETEKRRALNRANSGDEGDRSVRLKFRIGENVLNDDALRPPQGPAKESSGLPHAVEVIQEVLVNAAMGHDFQGPG